MKTWGRDISQLLCCHRNSQMSNDVDLSVCHEGHVHISSIKNTLKTIKNPEKNNIISFHVFQEYYCTILALIIKYMHILLLKSR